MATLQKIRTKAGLLVAIVIGLSLAAFILGDMLKSGSSLLQRDRLEIGVIDGESIQYPDFQKKVEELGEIMKQNYGTNQLNENMWAQVREQAWQQTINEIVMGRVYDELGITVSEEELFEMVQGSNIHPIIQQIFRNPQTGQFDRSAVIRFLKNLDTGVSQEQKAYWLNLEKQIINERMANKYNFMVAKGLYVTTAEAEESAKASNKSVNFDYIALAHSSVADDQITISDSDLKDYYNKHKKDYEQEKSRRIEYITFEVVPSKADYEAAEKWINDIKTDFENASDNVQFVNANSDVDFENVWYKKEDLPTNIAEWVFDQNAAVNSVFGPYKEGDAYKLAKLHKREMMPDSVQARHILISVQSQADYAKAQSLADSLKNEIEKGADFAQLAEKFSDDKGSAINGGDLGWFRRGQMVQPFEEAAFNQKAGEVSIATSQFGIHIVQTTKRGKLVPQVQIAYLVRNVIPSTRTYQNVYAQASKFAGENTSKEAFDAAISAQNINKRVAIVGENDRQIAGLENARPLIRAAYEAEVGDILQTTQGSPIFELGDSYVIAVLAQATEKGVAPFESVRARVELAVSKEKKAEYLVEKANKAIEGKNDLAAVATELNAQVQNASNVTFNSFSIPGMGIEPAVIGTATTIEPNKISKPVAGTNAVYVLAVTSVTENQVSTPENEKVRLTQSQTYRAASQASKVQRDAVEIEDYRSKFY